MGRTTLESPGDNLRTDALRWAAGNLPASDYGHVLIKLLVAQVDYIEEYWHASSALYRNAIRSNRAFNWLVSSRCRIDIDASISNPDRYVVLDVDDEAIARGSDSFAAIHAAMIRCEGESRTEAILRGTIVLTPEGGDAAER